MIPHTKQHNLTIGGAVGESKEYSFEMNAHMASLLSDKLYSNKVEAIIRELACNAQDSHVEAGILTPIDVHLPTALEPFFYVEDFGVGLTHDEVMTLYTTYGASTKRGTNTQVGQFGLGSKVFFAYTEQATITATKNGIRRIYSAFKDESGMPHITTMGTKENINAPNGLKVYVGVLPGDIEAFQESAQSIFRRFDPRPNVLGQPDYKCEDYESLVEGNGWLLRKENLSYRYQRQRKDTPYAIQGNVAYRISEEEMRTHAEGTGVLFMLELPFDIIFEIGQLDVASSREELSYNKQTIAAIITRFSSIFDELNTKIIPDLFKDCKTKWEATKTLSTLCKAFKNSHYTELISGAAIFNGEKVDTTIKFDLSDSVLTGVSIKFLTEREFSLKNISFSKSSVNKDWISLDGEKEYFIFWDDGEKPKQPSRLKKYMLDICGVAYRRSSYYHTPSATMTRYPYIVIVIVTPKKTNFLKIIEALGHHPYQIFNDIIPELPKVVRAKGSSSTVKRTPVVVKFSGDGGPTTAYGNEKELLRRQWDEVEVDVKVQRKGYYVNLRQSQVSPNTSMSMPQGIKYKNIIHLYQWAHSIGLVDRPSEIYGVPGNIKNPFENLPGWHLLGETIVSRTLEWFQNPVNIGAIAIQDAFEVTLRSLKREDYTKTDCEEQQGVNKIKQLLTLASKHGKLPVESTAKEFLDYINSHNYDPDIIKIYTGIQDKYLRSNDIKLLIRNGDKNKKSIVKTLVKHHTAIITKYPLLQNLVLSIDDIKDAKSICQYIQLMEK